ncbi:hypothetical protein B0J11DRAFT_534649 [Dendryphion nanum]|uniref:Uncharacterized protein n=1 Tax=Dendryphion nanum TaxID=256645 RepID=A0A9P9DIU7_9PLEO|nr:hypothetical protein B0J11DRAFT_534649 [Dendryphion nanum]
MDCTTVVDKFNIIQIHTAKCSKCDKRNKEKMRRCPGCTFQICQPCFHAQNGQPLHHGNSSLRFAALATPPRRSPASRRIHGAGVAAGNGEVANQDAGPNAVPTGKGLRPDGIGALDANAGAGAGPESSSPMTVNAETNAANAQAPSNPPMKETPPQNLFGSEKRACTITAKKTAAGKRTATAMNSDSDEYFPTTASANTDSKRCKSIAQNTPAVGQQIRLPACSPRRQTRAANTKVYFVDMPSPHGLAPAAGSRNDAPLTTGYDSESDHDHDHRGERSSLVKEGLAPKPSSTRKVKKSVKGRRYIPLYQPRFPSSAPLGSIQQLLEEAGVNTADKPYIEHPLSRHMPVTQNPVTGFELLSI